MKNHLHKVERKFDYTDKNEYDFILNQSERSQPIPQSYYTKFLRSLKQEDFAYYPNTKNFKEKIDILHLDCDLYQSYLDSLNGIYKNINNGGVVIFDEYYSLKYPGARIAVDEFFSNHKSDCFEKYITEDSFERWCVVK